jgi:hypothetical protein
MPYDLWRSDGACERLLVERYADDAATLGQKKSDHDHRIGRRMGAFFRRPPAVYRVFCRLTSAPRPMSTLADDPEVGANIHCEKQRRISAGQAAPSYWRKPGAVRGNGHDACSSGGRCRRVNRAGLRPQHRRGVGLRQDKDLAEWQFFGGQGIEGLLTSLARAIRARKLMRLAERGEAELQLLRQCDRVVTVEQLQEVPCATARYVAYGQVSVLDLMKRNLDDMLAGKFEGELVRESA